MATAVSIDIGGTQAKLALVDEQGAISARRHLDTRACRKLEEFVAGLFAEVEFLLREAGRTSVDLEGIGIGAPSCNEFEGTIARAANLPFDAPYPIRHEVESRFRLPTRLIKDSSAAALGEHLFGGARDMTHFILLTLGTGLGSGVMVDGRIVRGGTGLASEFGHSLVDPAGRECGCGRRGCLETYVSATGIVRTAFALMAEMKADSPLRRRPFAEMTAEHLFEAARAGDPISREAFARTGRTLGIKITDLIVALEPQAIFLSGGLATSGDLLLAPTLAAVRQHELPLLKNKVQILQSELGAHDAALLGAAAPILHQQKVTLS